MQHFYTQMLYTCKKTKDIPASNPAYFLWTVMTLTAYVDNYFYYFYKV